MGLTGLERVVGLPVDGTLLPEGAPHSKRDSEGVVGSIAPVEILKRSSKNVILKHIERNSGPMLEGLIHCIKLSVMNRRIVPQARTTTKL